MEVLSRGRYARVAATILHLEICVAILAYCTARLVGDLILDTIAAWSWRSGISLSTVYHLLLALLLQMLLLLQVESILLCWDLLRLLHLLGLIFGRHLPTGHRCEVLHLNQLPLAIQQLIVLLLLVGLIILIYLWWWRTWRHPVRLWWCNDILADVLESLDYLTLYNFVIHFFDHFVDWFYRV